MPFRLPGGDRRRWCPDQILRLHRARWRGGEWPNQVDFGQWCDRGWMAHLLWSRSPASAASAALAALAALAATAATATTAAVVTAVATAAVVTAVAAALATLAAAATWLAVCDQPD